MRFGIKGVRTSALSRVMIKSPRRIIRPLSAVVSTNINIEKTVVPLYRPVYGYSPFRIGGMESQVCYFSKGSNLRQGSNDDGEGDDDKNSSSSNEAQSPFSSPLAGGNADNARSVRRKSSKKFVPRKAAVKLSEKARTLFQKLLENHPTRDGILLDYKQSSTGQPRMVFSFSFVSKDELHERDEGVSLEVDEDGNPKSPAETLDDGLPKLYIHHNAFLKVLGSTVDVDTKNITPVLYDKEGFELDSNA